MFHYNFVVSGLLNHLGIMQEVHSSKPFAMCGFLPALAAFEAGHNSLQLGHFLLLARCGPFMLRLVQLDGRRRSLLLYLWIVVFVIAAWKSKFRFLWRFSSKVLQG